MKIPVEYRVPALLLGIYLLENLVAAAAPLDRVTWLAESLTAWIPLAFILVWYLRGGRLSAAAWLAMAPWFLLQTVGAHYSFEHVPFDWITEIFGFQRNHFDRVCHFCVGGFAFPVIEILERRELIRGRGLTVFFVVMGVFGFAALFEVIEMLYAICASPEAGAAFLGSQGDIWDAQKDMLADGLGAMCFSAFYCLLHPAGAKKE
ncbi:MAG: DUF2238 domain-containing protein [Lentisphaeria bacterium]|nr:DUF2238 domain-containing protein [Lentisphaeria bacterium]